MQQQKTNSDNKISFTFNKRERLTSRKIINNLFTNGESFFVYPLKVVFMECNLPLDVPVQAGFTVGKKNFKRAVKRNIIKRKMREAYRLNKHRFGTLPQNKQIAVFFIFTGKEIPDFSSINSSVIKAIEKIIAKV